MAVWILACGDPVDDDQIHRMPERPLDLIWRDRNRSQRSRRALDLQISLLCSSSKLEVVRLAARVGRPTVVSAQGELFGVPFDGLSHRGVCFNTLPCMDNLRSATRGATRRDPKSPSMQFGLFNGLPTRAMQPQMRRQAETPVTDGLAIPRNQVTRCTLRTRIRVSLNRGGGQARSLTHYASDRSRRVRQRAVWSRLCRDHPVLPTDDPLTTSRINNNHQVTGGEMPIGTQTPSPHTPEARASSFGSGQAIGGSVPCLPVHIDRHPFALSMLLTSRVRIRENRSVGYA